MSRLTTGILSVFTLSLISGAAQYALGRDLSPVVQIPLVQGSAAAEQVSPSSITPPAGQTLAINRGAKADRAAGGPLGSPAQSKTVSLTFSGYSDTTFLLRVPVAEANPPPPRSQARPPSRRQMVACEPVVSILTDVAKQLQPGRCVA